MKMLNVPALALRAARLFSHAQGKNSHLTGSQVRLPEEASIEPTGRV